jgi:porin
LKTRSTLTGDWNGRRTELYEEGFTFDATVTQVLQGVASGGADDNGGTFYNGLAEINATLDTAKLGWWSGGMFGFTLQSSWGDPITTEAGNLSPVNMLPMWPRPFENSTELTEYYLTQALPGNNTLIIGRLDATNFIDHSRYGNNPETQFLNASLNNKILFGSVLSFSTYGALFSHQLSEDSSVAFAAFTPETQPGDYSGDWSKYGVAALAIKQYDLGGLPGSVSPIVAYVNKDADALNNPRFVPGLITGDVPTKEGNWVFEFQGDQMLWRPPGSNIPAARGGARETHYVGTQEFESPAAGVGNLPGFGLFYRFGFQPKDRNPWNIFLSGGVGARGVIPGRPYDRMGIGAFVLLASDDIKSQPIIGDLLEDEWGAEAFYNHAITPALQLSFSVQYVDPGVKTSDDAVVVGTWLFTWF